MFQMTGKRSRSFKCAVHHRDREVSSENDFHLLLVEPPLFRRCVLKKRKRSVETPSCYFRCVTFCSIFNCFLLGIFRFVMLQDGHHSSGWIPNGRKRPEVLCRPLHLLPPAPIYYNHHSSRGNYRYVSYAIIYCHLFTISISFLLRKFNF